MIEIRFGLLVDRLDIQLKAQHIDFDRKKVQGLQKDLDAIDRLFANELISDTQRNKLREKILERIKKAIHRRMNRPLNAS